MELNQLIEKYTNAQTAKDKEEIEKEIWVRFGEKTVVLVIDMSGFTKTVKDHGIVHYLSMINEMQKIVRDSVESSSGRIIKFEADNAFVVFKVPKKGLLCSLDLFKKFEYYNLIMDDSKKINIQCGLDYGDCLFPTESDFFGDVVNVASKLGEDLAQKGQILISPNFYNEVKTTLQKLPDKEQKTIEVVEIS